MSKQAVNEVIKMKTDNVEFEKKQYPPYVEIFTAFGIALFFRFVVVNVLTWILL